MAEKVSILCFSVYIDSASDRDEKKNWNHVRFSGSL